MYQESFFIDIPATQFQREVRQIDLPAQEFGRFASRHERPPAMRDVTSVDWETRCYRKGAPLGDEWTLAIDIAELRRAIGVVLDHIEETNGRVLAIPHDYFWSVPEPDVYRVEFQPELTVGQFSESWDNLRRERLGAGDSTVSHSAVWLGQIMQVIGHQAQH
jgi:hypothetical protein